MSQIITVTTKPNGAGQNWLEIGKFRIDEFDDSIWQPTAARYPNKDPRLTCKREYDGRGNSQKIHWKIIVPLDYPFTIYRRSGDKRTGYGCQDEVIWQPAEGEQ